MLNIFKKCGNSRTLKKAQKLILLGKDSDALKLLSDILSSDNSNSDIFLWSAVAKHNIKDYDGALSLINKAIDLNPQNSICKMVKGEILLALERYNESLEILTKALEDNPDNTRISYLLGVNHVRLGNIDKAASFFETPLQYDRELVDSRLLAMAEVYLHKNK